VLVIFHAPLKFLKSHHFQVILLYTPCLQADTSPAPQFQDKEVFYLDIRVLQYFLAVAREESITKAAEELVGLMEKTKAELASSSENINGDIYIGCGETEGISFLAQTACDLQKKHPFIHYHIYSGDAERVMEKLDKGLIDFGLLVDEADLNKYDYLKLSQKDLWGVLMCKDSPLAEKEAICAEDLWDKPLIVSHQASINTEMFRWLKTDISKLNIVATYDLIYNAAQFAKKSFGYVIALDRLVNTTGDGNLCFKPLSPALEAELCIVWKKYQIFSRASSVFLQWLKNKT